VRVTAAFSRLLDLRGVWVKKVRFEPDRVVVMVALRRRKLECPKCCYSTWHRESRQHHDSVWRHLDLGVWRLEVRCRLRRLRCPQHGALVEGVPFARYRARFTRDFDDLVAWLATKTDQTATCRLVRIDWRTVGRIIARVGAELIDTDRLSDLFEISIETVSSYCTSCNGFLRSMLDSDRVCDPLSAGRLDLVVEGDRELALADAACLKLASGDPPVDD
jgi:transposase